METAGKRVLVVDDDAVLLRTVARELRSDGWDVTTSAVPVDLAGFVGFDCALLDVEPHGPEMAAVCRAAGVPVVFMTGNDDRADELRSGREKVIDKPWQSGELDAALKEVCK